MGDAGAGGALTAAAGIPARTARRPIIERTGLIRRLAERFDHRVTLVTGPAGAGKSTLLSAAIDPDAPGLDLWIDVARTDGSGVAVGQQVAAAVDAPGRTDPGELLDAVTEAVWGTAPTPVAIILDDAHLLDETGVEFAQGLIEQLPANGSVVVVSRAPVGLSIGRRRAHGEVLDIGPTDLELDDDEIVRLSELRGGAQDLATLPRHAASADLQLVAGTAAGAEFVWDELLSRIDTDRMQQLRRVAVLDVLDDHLIDRLTDGAFDAAGLFGDLPLVSSPGPGRYELHEILRTALEQRLEPGEQVKALSLAGEAERDRHRLARAVEHFERARDPISAIECARQLALGPLLSSTVADAAAVRRTVTRLQPDSHLLALFEAYRHLDGNEHHAADSFVAAAAAARDAGDDEIETVALHRGAQLLLLQHRNTHHDLVDRIGELADRCALADAITRYHVSVEAQLAGDGDTARAVLTDLGALELLGPGHELQVLAERLTDLGHPEAVIAGLDRVDHDNLPPGADQWIGMAMLQCAVTTPEQILPLSLRAAAVAERRGFSHPACFTHSVASMMALACGDRQIAERHARLGRAHADTGVGPNADSTVRHAEAALLVDRDDEDAAVAVLRGTASETDEWPGRSELWALPIAYVLRPERRAVIDRAALGPSLSVARLAARALLAAREGDGAAASDLPWDRLDLLRVHVPRRHLVELAAVARAPVPAAADALEVIPDAGLLLGMVAASERATAAAAQAIVDTVPNDEPFGLRLELLGPVVVRRIGDSANSGVADLARRPKASELIGLLSERRRLDRFEVIGHVWPGHDDERKALGSLRTTLATLNDSLDPARAKGAAAFHLRADGDLLELDARVVTDVGEFESLIAAARTDDDAGLPRQALDAYRRALALYRGDLLHGIDAPWAELSRLRLRSLAVGAMCRVGELVAARGEPEEAARWADRALTFDPLDERAIRCLLGAMLAAGDVSGARAAADAAVRRLTAAGVEPGLDTRRVLERTR